MQLVTRNTWHEGDGFLKILVRPVPELELKLGDGKWQVHLLHRDPRRFPFHRSDDFALYFRCVPLAEPARYHVDGILVRQLSV